MIRQIKRIGRNISFLALASGIRGGSVFIINVYIGRVLGPKVLGIFALSFVFTTILFRLADLGLDIVTVKEVARDKSLASEYARQVLSMRLIAVTLITIVAFLSASFLYDPQVVIVIVLLSLYWGFIYLSYVLFSIFRAYEHMQHEATAFFISSLFVIVGGIYVIQNTQSIVNVAIIFAIAGAIQFGLGLTFYKLRFDWLQPAYTPQLWNNILKKGAPLGLAVIFLVVYTSADTVLLSLLTNEEQVGWYNAAYTLITASGLASTVILSALFPRFSILYKHKRTQLRQLYLMVFGFMALTGVIAGLVGTIFAEQIITLIYGSGYEPTISVFKVLIWVIVFLYTNNLCGITLNAVDKSKITMAIVAFAAAFNVILNLLFIPRFGLMAAGVTTLVTELFVLVISFLFLENVFRKLAPSLKKTADTLLPQKMT